ncbi:MAG: ATP-dependent transcriptional regulator [Rhodobacter sp.]|nr:ATP-dependent transcriptional regulator [Rhodobacter sp.]
MRLPFLLAAFCAVSACAPTAQVSKSRPQTEVGIGFGRPPLQLATGSGGSTLARDFMDLTFAMESGLRLEVFSRFEGPVTVALSGAVPPTAPRDLGALIGRLQREAGLDIAPASGGTATITVEFASRAELRRLAPQAACFVIPNVSSLAEYRRLRGSDTVDWALVTRRQRAAIFIPADTSPQEVRDCLHEELAQALGPLNDLYRLPNSVFNDDNFNSVLTDFDMDILRAYNSPALASGMTRAEVAARLPALLGGAPGMGPEAGATPAAWTDAVEAALGRQGSLASRLQSAERALDIATQQGWRDGRLAFSHFVVARLSAGRDPARALDEFGQAAAIYARLPGGEIQLAHIDMQLAAMALAGGLANEAVRLADRAIPVVRRHENAALLATLMLIKAEAMERLGDAGAAAALRLDSQPWARYGFGPDSVVNARMRDIAAVADRAANG